MPLSCFRKPIQESEYIESQCKYTYLCHTPLQVVFPHVGCLIADCLLCFLDGAAQETPAGLELLQKLQQCAVLLPSARVRKYQGRFEHSDCSV